MPFSSKQRVDLLKKVSSHFSVNSEVAVRVLDVLEVLRRKSEISEQDIQGILHQQYGKIYFAGAFQDRFLLILPNLKDYQFKYEFELRLLNRVQLPDDFLRKIVEDLIEEGRAQALPALRKVVTQKNGDI